MVGCRDFFFFFLLFQSLFTSSLVCISFAFGHSQPHNILEPDGWKALRASNSALSRQGSCYALSERLRPFGSHTSRLLIWMNRAHEPAQRASNRDFKTPSEQKQPRYLTRHGIVSVSLRASVALSVALFISIARTRRVEFVGEGFISWIP